MSLDSSLIRDGIGQELRIYPGRFLVLSHYEYFVATSTIQMCFQNRHS